MAENVRVVEPEGLGELILTIRAEHAGRIFSGAKTFELRKAAPRLVPRIVYLYESSGVAAITGHIVISRVLIGKPSALWTLTGNAATTKQRFEAYFSGKSTGVAFEVASTTKYKRPVTLHQLCQADPKFRVPQSFLYLKLGTKVSNLLNEARFRESLDTAQGSIKLAPLPLSSSSRFRKEVTRHISPSYAGAGESYPRELLAEARRDMDPLGVFTVRKRIISISTAGVEIGFVVLTEKIGGAHKTGPTVIFDRHRYKGYGKRFRDALHEVLRHYGSRKVYCSVSTKKQDAIHYLLGSGYRMEAHLSRQYHDDHDEVVFGFALDKSEMPQQSTLYGSSAIKTHQRVKRYDENIANFLQKNLALNFCAPPAQWGQRQVAISLRRRAQSLIKQRVIFAGYDRSVAIAAICVMKRDGAAKILLIGNVRVGHGLLTFLAFVEKSIARLAARRSFAIRKLYSHVPLSASEYLRAFSMLGYRIEGVLDRPYSPAFDMAVLGKQISFTKKTSAIKRQSSSRRKVSESPRNSSRRSSPRTAPRLR